MSAMAIEFTDYTDVELNIIIANLMREIGIPPHLKGYRYLLSAVKLVYTDSELIRNVLKELYMYVACEYDTTVSCVERNMRTALKTACEYGNLSVLDEQFGADACTRNISPRGFIAILSEKLRCNLISVDCGGMTVDYE
ncbi:MAG: sporulation initiation factor Spo0A C-terminal domain-containing protein [Clostridia bacterium]|nr:sporulation initiation factor Spo0A C-terminal domain-containing protein [Clostridia bacterium]